MSRYYVIKTSVTWFVIVFLLSASIFIPNVFGENRMEILMSKAMNALSLAEKERFNALRKKIGVAAASAAPEDVFAFPDGRLLTKEGAILALTEEELDDYSSLKKDLEMGLEKTYRSEFRDLVSQANRNAVNFLFLQGLSPKKIREFVKRNKVKMRDYAIVIDSFKQKIVERNNTNKDLLKPYIQNEYETLKREFDVVFNPNASYDEKYTDTMLQFCESFEHQIYAVFYSELAAVFGSQTAENIMWLCKRRALWDEFLSK